ncbi:MAG: glycosyl hydrolase [Parasphingorhabdus sp.]|uniref:glycosyl hydrolase n=1 Tax=Parasphingorhabdus sp. TaxID=2709688 RepID=UPI0032997A40
MLWLLSLIILFSVIAGLWLKSTIDTGFAIPDAEPNSALSWRDINALNAIADQPLDRPQVEQGLTPSYDAVEYDPSEILTPPRKFGPWAWWWWPGGDIDLEQVEQQLDDLAAMGFAGFEHEAFSVNTGWKEDQEIASRVLTVGTEDYFRKLGRVLEMLDERDMQIDLGESSGWPANGPHITPERGISDLSFAEMSINGGRFINAPLPKPVPTYADYLLLFLEAFSDDDIVNFTNDGAKIISVLAAKPISGDRSSFFFNLEDQLHLDPESVVDITDKVDGQGVVRWQAPDGEWLIIAAYQRPSASLGSASTGAYPRGGFVLDHFDKGEVRRHLEFSFGAETNLSKGFGKAVRGIFIDSAEFAVNTHITSDFLSEFEKRRGYSVAPLLPTIAVDGRHHFAAHSLSMNATPSYLLTDHDDNIRHDYDQTVSDLYIENYLGELTHWSNAKSMETVGEVFGLKIDTIRAMGRLDIPQTEQLYAGGTDLFLKLSSAAGALYGRRIVAAETFVSLGRDYTFTPRRLKMMADKVLLNGINQIHYHGITYPWETSSKEVGKVNWFPWSMPAAFNKLPSELSFTFNATPDNVFWSDLPPLNKYIARSHYMLRQGVPDYDLLIYYPFLGFPNALVGDGFAQEHLYHGYLADTDHPSMQTLGGETESQSHQLDDGKVRDDVKWLNQVRQLTHGIDAQGITWNWLNSHALSSGLVAPGKLPASGTAYKAILVPFVDKMPAADMERLLNLADAGTQIHILGDPPVDPPGYKQHAEQSARLARAIERAKSHPNVTFFPDKARYLPAVTKLPKTSLRFSSPSLARRVTRQVGQNGRIDFIASISAKDIALRLNGDPTIDRWIFNPMTGAVEDFVPLNDKGEFVLPLEPFGSRFIVENLKRPDVASATPCQDPDQNMLLDRWTVTSKTLEKDLLLDRLTDWRDVDRLRYHEGAADYSTTLNVRGRDQCIRLDLGLVQGAAEVYVNGQHVSRLAYHPFTVSIGEYLKEGENNITVRLFPAQRNASIGKALDGNKRFTQFRDRSEHLVATGLLGPVKIYFDRGNTTVD